MSENVCLSDLYLGKTDGAVEAKEDNFQELFYDPFNKYDELMSGNEKFLVLGSKGTGKTYLANYVQKSAKKGEYVYVVGETDYTMCKLNALSQEPLDDEIAVAFCKWFMLDRLAHLIVESHPCVAKYVFFSKIHKLKRFMENYENDDAYKIVKRILGGATEKQKSAGITFLSEKKWEMPLMLSKTKSDNYSTEEVQKAFFELIPSFEKIVFSAIGYKKKYTIIIDDIDEITSSKGMIGRDEIIINILKVAKDYNLLNDNHGHKFIVLLRTDILDSLQVKYSNLSKLVTSCAVELYWLLDNTSSEPFNHPLMSMIFHKIRKCNKKYEKYTNENLYNSLFPDLIDSKKPLDYILDHGFGRPRDVVSFLSSAQKESPDQTAFSALVLKEARKLYSANFYNELLNQTAYYGNPEFVKECFQLLASIKKPSFTHGDIEALYLVSKDNYNNISSVDEVLKFLYKLGAIGNSWKVQRSKTTRETHYAWSYKKDAMDEVDLSKKFTIHYGLRKKFAL